MHRSPRIWQSTILIVPLLSIDTNHNRELNKGVAPPGLTHLTYGWTVKHVREKTKNKRNKRLCTRVYVLISRSNLYSSCNILISPSTLCLRCKTANPQKHETSNVHAAYEATRTRWFIPYSVKLFLNS